MKALRRLRWRWDMANRCTTCGGSGLLGNARLRVCPDCTSGVKPYPPELEKRRRPPRTTKEPHPSRHTWR